MCPGGAKIKPPFEMGVSDLDLVGIRPPEIFTMGKMLDEEAMCYTVTDFVHAFC